jgi:uncharacterized protein (DUF58 family)
MITAEDLTRVSSLELRAQGIVEGFLQGLHRSPFVGFSVEFSSHRRYEPGDDLRHVNWKVYARQRKLYVKEFDAETNMNLYLLVDNTPSMQCKSGGKMTKLEYATTLAASLAHLGLKQRDAVALGMLGNGVEAYLDPSSKPGQWDDCLQMLATSPRCKRTSLKKSLEQSAMLAKHRGLVVLLSDLVDEHESDATAGFERGIAQLRHRGHEVVVFHVLDPWERKLPNSGRCRFLDLETPWEVTTEISSIRSAYTDRVNQWCKQIETICHDNGVDRIELTTDTSPGNALVDYLVRRAAMGGG